MLPFLMWSATLLWAGLIFYASSIPGSALASPIPDFVPHFLEFFILGLLCSAAVWLTEKKLPAGLASLWAISVCAIYAATDEFHQYFVPGRTPDIKDWAVDAAGILAAAGSVYIFRALRSRR